MKQENSAVSVARIESCIEANHFDTVWHAGTVGLIYDFIVAAALEGLTFGGCLCSKFSKVKVFRSALSISWCTTVLYCSSRRSNYPVAELAVRNIDLLKHVNASPRNTLHRNCSWSISCMPSTLENSRKDFAQDWYKRRLLWTRLPLWHREQCLYSIPPTTIAADGSAPLRCSSYISASARQRRSWTNATTRWGSWRRV